MTNVVEPSDVIEVRDAPSVPGLTYRRYRGEEDLHAFVDVYEACREVDGFSWILTLEEIQNNYRHLLNTDLDRDIVVVEHEGKIIGYSQQKWVEELDAIAFRHQQHLHPDWRGKGIRKAMLLHCEARAREVAATLSQDKPMHLSTWLCEDETALTALLEAEGHIPTRYFFEMVRDLREPIEDRPLPEGLEVRPVPADGTRKVYFAANEALKDHWAGREWTEVDYQEFMNDPIIDPALWMVAYDGDEVAGTVLNWVHEEENERLGRMWGYTEIITVQRPYRGKGLAKALITKSMLMLKEMGMEVANLGVDTENPSGALRLYTGLGYQTIKTYMIHRKDLGDGGMTDDTIDVVDAPDVPGLTFRRYRGDQDLPRLVGVFEAVSVEDDLDWMVTVDRLKNEFDNLPGFDPREDVVLAEVEDRTVGYSHIRWFEEPDGAFAAGHREWVMPKWRGRGILRALLAVNTARAKELAATHARGPARMGTVVRETEVHRRGVIEAAGYKLERTYLEMLRDLSEPIEVQPLPEGIDVRPTMPEDLRRIFEACWEAFRGSYSFREMTEKDWTGFESSPEFQPELWVVGWDGDEIAGEVYCWIDEEENARYERLWGYNDGVAVTKEYRRRGLAKALLSRSLVILRDLGMSHAYLGVDTQNPADALKLYEAVGYSVYKRAYDLTRPLDI